MPPQLAAGMVTLKLGFPRGAVHLMKAFIQLEGEAPLQAGAAVGGRVGAWAAAEQEGSSVWLGPQPSKGSCFHDVREEELTLP